MRLPPVLEGERRRLLGTLLALGLARALSAVAGVLLLRAGVDRSLAGAPAHEIVALALLLLLVAVAGALVKRVERGRAERLGGLYAAAVRARLLEHLLARPGAGGADRLGRLLARLSGELQAVRAWPGRGLPRLLSEGTLLLACAAAAFLLDPRIGGLVALLLAGAALVALRQRRGLVRAVVELRRARGRAAGRTGRLLARRLAGEAVDPETLGALARAERRAAGLAARRGRASAGLLVLPDLVRGAAVAALILLAGGLGPGRPISAGAVAGALALLAALVPAGRELARVLDRHAAWTVARERLERLLAEPAPPALAPAPDAAAAAQPRQPTA